MEASKREKYEKLVEEAWGDDLDSINKNALVYFCMHEEAIGKGNPLYSGFWPDFYSKLLGRNPKILQKEET